MTINTISSSIAVISKIIIVTVVPITIGIILLTDDGTLLALVLALALAVVNRELVDVVDITMAQRANHKSLMMSLLDDNEDPMLLVLYVNDEIIEE